MIRKIALASGVATALFLGATSSASAGTLDQQQTSSNANGALLPDQTPAQTFTAGISGVVDQVDLKLIKLGTPPATTVEIRNVAAGKPGSTVLASASIPGSAVGTTAAFVPATFTTPAPVTAGTQYAIVAYGPGVGGANVTGWEYQSATNPYPNGSMFVTNEAIPPVDTFSEFPTSDLAFKTYVAPAPPTPPTNTAQPAPKKCKKHKHKHDAASAKKKCKKKRH